MADTKIEFNLPKEIIDAHVRAAVVSTLNKNGEELVRQVVEHAFAEKERGYSTDLTIWQRATNKAIRDCATEAFNEWLAEMTPIVRKAVKDRLSGFDKKRTVDSIVEQLQAYLGNFSVEVTFPRRKDY